MILLDLIFFFKLIDQMLALSFFSDLLILILGRKVLLTFYLGNFLEGKCVDL